MQKTGIRLVSGFSHEQISFVRRLKKQRIGVQYYLKAPRPVDENKVADFVYMCRHVFQSISYDDIEKLRKIIKDLSSGFS